jgi:hypothetical protein
LYERPLELGHGSDDLEHHSFVESSEMKNIYDGVVTLNRAGEATIRVPRWVEVLNKDFRYQLTPMGRPAPNLHISNPLKKGYFKVKGGTKGLRVNWQLTGVRNDVWAKSHKIEVEQPKTSVERGHYLYPKGYGHSEEKGMMTALYPEQSRLRDRLGPRKNRSRRKPRH